jgi:molecular chaperone DnaK
VTGPVLGIDLGTTNSAVAVMRTPGRPEVLEDAEGHALIPSVVSFKPDGEVIVGRAAKERRLLDASNTIYSVKRLIGRPYRSEEVRQAQQRFTFDLLEGPKGGLVVATRGEKYTLSEISAFVLRQVRSVAEKALGETCTRAVITVPANFNELQRSATKAAGGVAGLEVLRILNEPTAAALAYGLDRRSAQERVAIFDLGGGTFDMSVLDLSGDVFEVVATAGDSYLGGDDIDLLIADQMAFAFLERHRYDPRQDPQAFERLRAAAEWAKVQLSTESEVQLTIEELAYGSGGKSLDLVFEISRDTLESLAQPLLARSFDVCEDAMRVAGMRATDLDTVILVGGATRMPLVQRMVAEYFGAQPLADIDPDLVVAKGAAVQAHALSVPRRRAPVAPITASSLPPPATGAGGGAVLGRIQMVTKPTRTPARPSTRPRVVEERPSPDAAGRRRRGGPPPPPVPGSPQEERTRDLRDSMASGLLTLDDPTGEPSGAHRVPPAPTSGRPGVGEAPPRARGLDESTKDVSSAISGLDEATRDVSDSIQPGDTREEATRSLPPGTLEGWESAPPSQPPPPLGAELDELEGEGPTDPRGRRPSPRGDGPVPPPPPAAPMPEFFGGSPGLPDLDGPRPALPSEPSLVDPVVEAAPLLLDVTPMSLGIETVGGYCEAVVRRNAAIPVEHSRVFSTGRDGQREVKVRIYQGESRRLVDNQGLGEIELTGLRPAPRGAVKIEVAFLIDADGTLDVRAKDLATGKEQTVRVNLIGGLSEDEIRRMQDRQAAKLGLL